MKMKINIALVLLLLNSFPVFANINIFACEPEWAALSKELGGDNISVISATSGLQDPHHIQARPSLIAKARRADLVVCTGAELEIGWLPLLQRKSGNSSIQTGAQGYFMAADYVRLSDVPKILDRSLGHIHAAGNPHIQTSPLNILQVAKALTQKLQEIDAENAAIYQQRWNDFSQRWEAAIENWQQRALPLRDIPVVVQHNNWSYLFDWLKIKKVAVLESKPGVPPSVEDLNKVLIQLKGKPAKMVINAAYQSSRATDWLVSKTGINKVILPFTIGGDEHSKDLFSLFDDTIQRLLDANK